MSKTATVPAAATATRPAEAATLPLEAAVDLARLSMGTALEAHKRGLDFLTRQHALTLKTAHDVLGLYDETIRQSLADGQEAVVSTAARVKDALDRLTLTAAV